MRDRLTEIIGRWDSTEPLVDHLIKNGVIVPPCKAGDSIYKVVKPKSSNVSDGWIVEQKVAGFHLGDIPRLRGNPRKEYFIIFHEPTGYISHIPFDKLGKTVFLTKEEAEEHLQKGTN